MIILKEKQKPGKQMCIQEGLQITVYSRNYFEGNNSSKITNNSNTFKTKQEITCVSGALKSKVQCI